MARKILNKKVAIIGSLFMVVVLLGAIFVMLKYSKDPAEFLRDAEVGLVEVDSLMKELQAKGDYSEEDEEAVGELYGEIEGNYKKAFGCTKSDSHRIEILFTLSDFYLTDNEFYEPVWKKVRGCWNQIVTLDTKNIEARMNLFNFIYEIETTLSSVIAGGNPALWNDVEKQALEIIDVMAEKEQDIDPYILKARAWATLEIGDSGQTSNPEGNIDDAIRQFESLLEQSSGDAEVYELLGRAYVVKGEMRSAAGLSSAVKSAKVKQEEILQLGVEKADDKAQAMMNLLEVKRVEAGSDKELLDSLKADYEGLAAKYDSNAEVFVSLAKFYSISDQFNFDIALEAMTKAVDLDSDNVLIALGYANHYFTKAMVESDNEALDKAIGIATDAFELPDARDIAGPKQSIAGIYRSSLRDLLAKAHIERSLAAQEAGDDEQSNVSIAAAEKVIHEIKQVIKANEFVFNKWDGLVAMIKGDETSAISHLYYAQEAYKTEQKVDPLVSYYLSKLLEGRSEIGSRVKFLADSLNNSNSAFVSIASTKPAALLDYADIMIQLRQYNEARGIADIFEQRHGKNDRSNSILVLCDIHSGSYDDAASKIAEMDPQSADTISYKLLLLNTRILYLAQELRGADESDYSFVELKDLKRQRDEVYKTLLRLDPEKAVFPIAACDDYVANGDVDSARKLVDVFLASLPDDVDAKDYSLRLKEADPKIISKERRIEMRVKVLSGINDELERYIALGKFYYSLQENEKALEQYQRAFEIDPASHLIVGGLFDAALKLKDMELANKMLSIAMEENFDKCGGEFYSARLDIANESYQTALEKLDSCIKTRPIFPYAYLLKSQTHSSLSNYEESVKNAVVAASMNSLDGMTAKQVVMAMNERNINLGDNVTSIHRSETKTALMKAVALNPGEWQLQSLYADYIKDQEPDIAIAVQQQLAARVPTVGNNLKLASMAIEIAAKEINKEKKQFLLGIAGPAFEKAYSQEPENESVLELYSEYLRTTNKHDLAMEILGGKDSLSWRFHIRDGQFEKAKDVLMGLYQVNSEEIDVLQGLMLVSQKLGDKDGLKRYSEELIEADKTPDNELQQIQMFLDVGFVSEADLKLESFMTRYPDEPKAFLLKAWATMSNGKLDKALGLVEKNLVVEPENAIAWRLRGQIHSLLGDYKTAIEDLRKSRSFDDTPAIQIELARTYNRVGNIDKAIGILAVALTDDRAPVQMRLMLEELYIKANRKSDLDKFYSDTLYKYPESINWYFRAGRSSLINGRYLRAEEYFLKAWQLSQESGGSLASLDGYLSSLIAGRKYAQAIRYAGNYIESQHAPVAYLNMANAEVKLENRRKAKESYLTAIEKSGDNSAFVLKILGIMSNLLGSEHAISWCKEQFLSDPDSLPANQMMSRLVAADGQYEEAISYIDNCLNAVDPEGDTYLEYVATKGAIVLQGYMATSQEQYLDRALEIYESILVKRPNNSGVLNNLAYLYADNDRELDKAVEYGKRAHEMSPNDANKMDTYAYVLCKAGEFEQAKELLQSAINLFSKENTEIAWDVYEHLGMAQEGLGGNAEAAEAYRQALKAAGENISEKNKRQLLQAIERVTN